MTLTAVVAVLVVVWLITVTAAFVLGTWWERGGSGWAGD